MYSFAALQSMTEHSRPTNVASSIDEILHPVRLREVLESVFSFEFIVLAYIYSGLYKESPLISAVFPIDPTVILVICIVVWMPVIIASRTTKIERTQLHALFTLTALIAYCCLSVFWSPSSTYALSKTFYLLFISMLAFLAILTIATDPLRLRRFMLANVFLSTILLISLIAFVLSNEVAQAAILANERFFIFGIQGVYQVLSRLFAFAILSFLIGLWFSRGTSIAWVVLLPITVLKLYFILQTGGRGGLLGLLVGLLILGAYLASRATHTGLRLSTTRLSFLVVLSAGFIVYLLYIYTSGNIPTTLARIMEPKSLPNSYIYGYRAYLLLQIPEFWSENPIFGNGLGSYPILMGHGDIRYYPHNVLAEILVELGLVGLLLYALFLAMAVRSWWEQRTQLPTYLWLFSIVGLSFGLAMASVGSDLTSNRAIWMAYGLVFASYGVKNREKES